MALEQVPLLEALLEDLPSRLWSLRFDVASPAYLLTWATVLGRKVPPLLNVSTTEAKAMSRDYDFFFGCPKVATALLYTMPDGGYGDDPLWQCCVSGIACMLYVTNETTGRSRFVERVYELPEPYRGSRQVHGTGSHLFLSVLPNALPGHAKLTHKELMGVMNERREDARAALDARVKGCTWQDVGAHELSALSLERVRFADDDLYSEPAIFEAWAKHNGIEYTLLSEHELRGGFDETIEEKVLKEGAKMSRLRHRIVSWLEANDEAPLPVGAHEKEPGVEEPRITRLQGAAAADAGQLVLPERPRAAQAQYGRAAAKQAASDAVDLAQRRVLVYWAGDDTWYAGLVKVHSSTRGHQVAYDDGTVEWHHLDSPTHEWPWKFE